MKALRTILTAVILFVGAMTMNAQRMSYEAMSSNARFLTDRMAYTLGIRDPFIIDDIYRINYDYIYGVNNYLDEVALGYYYEDYNSILLARDYALRNLLGDLLWNRLIGYSYFYRPIVFANRGWHFSIYDYDHHGPHHFFYSAPRPFGSRYAGGHFFHGMAPRGGHPGGAMIGGGRRGDFHDDHYRPQGNMNMNNRPNGNMNNNRPNGNINMNNGRPQGNTIINVNNNNSRPNVGDIGGGRPNGNMNISGNDRPQDRPQGNINVNNNTRPQVNANGMNNNVSRPNTGNSFSSENRGGSFRSENNNRSSSRTFGGNNNIRPTSPSMSSSSRSSSSSMSTGSGTRSGGSFSSGSRGGSPSMGNNSRGGGSFSGGTRGGGSFGGGSHGGGSRMGGGRR